MSSSELKLTPEDLLAGADAVFDVAVPREVLRPGNGAETEAKIVTLAPISIGTFQLIM